MRYSSISSAMAIRKAATTDGGFSRELIVRFDCEDNALIGRHQLIQSGTRFEANGNDPWLLLKPGRRLRRGWYRIDLKAEFEGQAEPRLYFNFGHGFQERFACPLHRVGSGFSAIVRAYKPTLSLRLDPTELPGKFELLTLSISPAPWLALAGLRLRQIAATLASALRKPSAWRDNLRNLRKGYLYSVPQPPPLVSIIIPTRDAVDLLKLGISSVLEKTIYPNYEIMIIDNRSEKSETLRFFRKITEAHANVRVLAYDEAFNFSAINNFAVSHAHGSVLVLLNNDIEVISPDWLDEMVAHAMRPEVGCVGAKLFYPGGSVQHGGVILGIGGVAGHAHKYFPQDADGYFSRLKVQQNLTAVTAACLAVRKEVYLQVEGLEEENLRVAFNDVDFCLRVRAAGYLNVFTPFARLHHHESISRGLDNTPEKMERFNREVVYMRSRWGPLLDADPYYSPNLTLHTEDFALRT